MSLAYNRYVGLDLIWYDMDTFIIMYIILHITRLVAKTKQLTDYFIFMALLTLASPLNYSLG